MFVEEVILHGFDTLILVHINTWWRRKKSPTTALLQIILLLRHTYVRLIPKNLRASESRKLAYLYLTIIA